MDWQRFLFPIFAVDAAGRPGRFLGNACPIDENGGLLTCRHVIEGQERSELGVYDFVEKQLRRVHNWLPDPANHLDLVYMPNALPAPRQAFYPIMDPGAIWDGAELFTYGFYRVGEELQRGHFRGHLVSTGAIRKAGPQILSLPFPVIEGISGSAVITQHRGHKLIGVCFGSQSQRVRAYEIIDQLDGATQYKETAWRVVEYGQAYHAAELVAFADRLELTSLSVAKDRTTTPGLDDEGS